MEYKTELKVVQDKIIPPLEAVDKGFGFMGTLLCTEDETQIQCHKCGHLFAKLTPHITYAHNFNSKQYKEEYGLNQTTPLLAPVVRERYIKSAEKSLPYWARNLTREDFKKKARELSIKSRVKGSKRRRYTAEQMNKFGTCPAQTQERFIQLHEKLGHTPTFEELQQRDAALLATIYRRFKSYSSFLTMLGLKSGKRSSIGEYSFDEIKELIKKFVDEKQRCICPGDTKIGFLPDYMTITKYFDGWMNAKQFSFEYLAEKYPEKALDYDKRLRRIDSIHINAKPLKVDGMGYPLMKNQKQEVCKCGHNESQHNMGGKYACLIDYNDDGCLEFQASQSEEQ